MNKKTKLGGWGNAFRERHYWKSGVINGISPEGSSYKLRRKRPLGHQASWYLLHQLTCKGDSKVRVQRKQWGKRGMRDTDRKLDHCPLKAAGLRKKIWILGDGWTCSEARRKDPIARSSWPFWERLKSKTEGMRELNQQMKILVTLSEDPYLVLSVCMVPHTTYNFTSKSDTLALEGTTCIHIHAGKILRHTK